MSFILPALPYALDALAPHLSKETLEYHYGKHHATYVTNLNKLLEGSPLAEKTLEELITNISAVPEEKRKGVFNNAAQVWNHTFYWNCLTPKSERAPKGKLADKITQQFGSVDQFKQAFDQACITLFGSGWAWLTQNQDGSLAIVQTSNAETPLTQGKPPLLTFDVWEHAYYVDYRNSRPEYLKAIWNLVNWDFVASHLK